jgi:hypothetical protein
MEMAAVRVFGYKSIVQLTQSGLRHFNADSVFVREEPYVWASGPIALNGTTPVDFPPQSNDQATMVVVEVDDGTAVRYEVNLNGPGKTTTRSASVNSPKLSGENVFQWVAGATMSFIDANGT